MCTMNDVVLPNVCSNVKKQKKMNKICVARRLLRREANEFARFYEVTSWSYPSIQQQFGVFEICYYYKSRSSAAASSAAT